VETPTIWAAFLAGIVSFISPCVLPLFPVYLSIAGAAPGSSRFRMFFSGLLIMIGFTAMFMAMMGPIIAFFGTNIISSQPWTEKFVGVLFIILGLWMFPLEGVPILKHIKKPLALIPSKNLRLEEHSIFKKKYASFFLPLAVGVSLAIIWIPCISVYLGVILILAGSQDTLFSGLYLLLVYCAGFATPFLVASLFIDKAKTYFKRLGPVEFIIKIIAGVLVIGFGIVILTGNLLWLIGYFVF